MPRDLANMIWSEDPNAMPRRVSREQWDRARSRATSAGWFTGASMWLAWHTFWPGSRLSEFAPATTGLGVFLLTCAAGYVYYRTHGETG